MGGLHPAMGLWSAALPGAPGTYFRIYTEWQEHHQQIMLHLMERGAPGVHLWRGDKSGGCCPTKYRVTGLSSVEVFTIPMAKGEPRGRGRGCGT